MELSDGRKSENNFAKRIARTNDKVFFENLYTEKKTKKNEPSI